MTNQTKWGIRLAVSLLLIAVIFSLSIRAKAQDEMPGLELEHMHYMPSVRYIPETQIGLGPPVIVFHP